MNEKLAQEIYEISHITGRFKLRSGTVSNEYFDKYLFESNPTLLDKISDEMMKFVTEDIDIIAGLEMGGIPIATALSLKTKIPLVFVRKTAKEYGTGKLAEGPDIKNKKLLIIEDIVTTGGQIISSVKELRAMGAEVSNVLCVIQREDEASKLLLAENLELSRLFTMEYIKSVIKE